jgi:hypothetical protein
LLVSFTFMNNKTEILPEDIYNGMEVIDDDGLTGVVIDSSDTHNVYVDYRSGSMGLYCLDKNCDEYDPLFKVE